MYIKIVMLVMFVFSSSSVFAKEIQFEDLSEELLSGLNNKERAATGYLKKNPPKKVVVKKNVPDAAFLKAVARQLEMDQLDADVEAFKKKEAEKASVRVETASQPVVNVVLPRDEAAEKAWLKKVNHTLASAKVAKKKLNLQKIKQMVLKSNVHIFTGLSLSGFNSWNTLGQPIGFATESSDSNGVKYELSFQGKFKRFGFEWLPFSKKQTLSTEFYGASLGEIEIKTTSMFIGKFYPIDMQKYSISVGLGAEHTKLDGAVSLGGIKFPTKGEGWSPVFQIGGQYQLADKLSMEVDYNKRNVRIITEIPGVPDLVSSLESSYSFRLVYKLF